MKLPIIELVVIALVTATSILPLPARAQRTFTPSFEAKVVHVDDGDTVVARLDSGVNIKVRLANIDAPEENHGGCRPGQPYASASTASLKRMVLGKTIHFDCSTLDRYDRHVCDLQTGATTANIQLVSQGLAWANRANPSYLRDQRVAQAEADAMRLKQGLWASGEPVAPWEWRHTVWTEACGRQ